MINQLSSMQPMAYSMPSSIFPVNYASQGSTQPLAMASQFGPPGLLQAPGQNQMAGPLEVMGQMMAMMFNLVEKLVSTIVNLVSGSDRSASTANGADTSGLTSSATQTLPGAVQSVPAQPTSTVQGNEMLDSVMSILKKTQEYKDVVGDLFGSFMKSAKSTLGPIIDTVGSLFSFGGGGIFSKIAKIF